ncbi:Uncharacterised protein [Mycobacteroides abscessus subsp. abscessus]|nr:Uncharacterised protein [Mycobacteroides abscessus subsp. abscessus]
MQDRLPLHACLVIAVHAGLQTPGRPQLRGEVRVQELPDFGAELFFLCREGQVHVRSVVSSLRWEKRRLRPIWMQAHSD